MRDRNRRPSRWVFALLLLGCAGLVTLDHRQGADSPVNAVRDAVAEVVGPVEEGTAALVRPLREVPGVVRTNRSLQAELDRLRAENANLRTLLATAPLDRQRLEQLDGLLRSARDTGYALVAARVVAMGPAQSFSRTVTIDAGRSSGVRPDMTVLDNDGLVGRVVRASRSSATVLLVIDQESVVGGRLASSREVGFLRGRGDVGGDARLDLTLVDNAATPGRGDVVVTWGSEGGAPYVAGIPVGAVRSVQSSPRQLSKEAVIEPAVDFSSLDVVAVVVDPGTQGDRPLIRADGALGEVR